MAIQLKRTSQTPKSSAAIGPPQPKGVPKESGKPAEQPEVPPPKGPPAKKGAGKPQDQLETVKENKKDEADSTAAQRKIARKSLSIAEVQRWHRRTHWFIFGPEFRVSDRGSDPPGLLCPGRGNFQPWNACSFKQGHQFR